MALTSPPGGNEVEQPILNRPFDEPSRHWYIREGESPLQRPGRRPPIIFPPRDQRQSWSPNPAVLRPATAYPGAFEMVLVALIRQRLSAWRDAGYPGASRTTLELIQHWTREGRQTRLFFAQLEAALTVIFLAEARGDLLQGVNVPREDAGTFLRYACKMATGAGKTTVMAMVAAWSILNKHASRQDARFSDGVLILCPSVPIRDRLRELDPALGAASLYRARDLVPGSLMPSLTQGHLVVTNWHTLAPQSPGIPGGGARVSRAGVEVRGEQTIHITAAAGSPASGRGRRLTAQEYERQRAAGLIEVIEELPGEDGRPAKIRVATTRRVESDTALVNRVLGQALSGKQNLLVMNDEAHHAYRMVQEQPENWEAMDAEERQAWKEEREEATVWVEGLDKIQRQRRINFCLDLSATPYFLGRTGQEENKPFPWIVSDFGLIDAIESGLVKIPQLAVRDTTGEERAAYFHIWQWITQQKLTPGERGGKRAGPKPEAILKYANHPVAMLATDWAALRKQWEAGADPRPPVFILVCKNIKLADTLFQWIAENRAPAGVPPLARPELANLGGRIYTIRVDSKVIQETDTDGSKSDEVRWMRFTLETVGKSDWRTDQQGRPIYPEGFEDLAGKLCRPLHPPGRDVRCIVSVGMLTEGWDCNTVTHIIGIRPFTSQLLCEQVVGRGLRRASYEVTEEGYLTEEVAQVLGVPFEVIPVKALAGAPPAPPPRRHHIHPLPERSSLAIQFPRVEGYTQRIRNRIAVDWDKLPPMTIAPERIPPEYERKGLAVSAEGRLSLSGPGAADKVTLQAWRAERRTQQIVFEVATGLTAHYCRQPGCTAPPQVLFPQLARIADRYLREKVTALPPADAKDAALSPYWGWLIETLTENIRPAADQGESPEVPLLETRRGPGSTAEADFWTSRDVREVRRSHLNYVVADTGRWEQTAAYHLDTSPHVASFAKNAGLGFAIPYLHNGQVHDYVPDFLVRLRTIPARHLILEVKGYDPLEEVKRAAARRWVDAVTADGAFGSWDYAIVHQPSEIPGLLAARTAGPTA